MDEINAETPTRPRALKILNNANRVVGPEKAAKELGRSILKDVFDQKELESIRSNIRKTHSIIGTGFGTALIHSFAIRGRTSVVQWLLENNAEIDAKDGMGRTPLICAVIYGQVDTVKLLLERGADIEATFEGNTVLMEAVMQNHEGIALMLLEHKVDKEAQNKAGNTALQIAAACDYVRIVRHLLEAGANINTKDKKGITPLMSAAIRNKLWMVELLLDRGADVDAKDKDGETALEIHQNKQGARILAFAEAYEKRNTPIAKLLKDETNRRRRLREIDDGGLTRRKTVESKTMLKSN